PIKLLIVSVVSVMPSPHSSVSKSIIPVIINYQRIFYIHSLSFLASSINRSIKATIIINSAI
ncbi:hypothetical protein JRE37_01345, partial [Listeria monocytogenes]|uniref:hypothetical protein n=1 Tax=Listeria monocytogenes TaxID=1639 RepID=UPI001AD9D762